MLLFPLIIALLWLIFKLRSIPNENRVLITETGLFGASLPFILSASLIYYYNFDSMCFESTDDFRNMSYITRWIILGLDPLAAWIFAYTSLLLFFCMFVVYNQVRLKKEVPFLTYVFARLKKDVHLKTCVFIILVLDLLSSVIFCLVLFLFPSDPTIVWSDW